MGEEEMPYPPSAPCHLWSVRELALGLGERESRPAPHMGIPVELALDMRPEDELSLRV